MNFLKKIFTIKKKEDEKNSQLYKKVNELIKNRSMSVQDLFENKTKVVNHLSDLNKKIEKMSPEEVRKMVSEELKKNK
jgi:translation initiation factor IF-1